MFARLILALLLTAFALPAMANGPCHDAPVRAQMAMAGMHHDTPAPLRHDDRSTVSHVCLGCIPPASLATRVLTGPLAVAVAPRRIAASAFDPNTGIPPALPPPRIGA